MKTRVCLKYYISDCLWVFCQVFLPPQKKRSVIIINKHGIYELAHELLNDLGLRILGNHRNTGKL